MIGEHDTKSPGRVKVDEHDQSVWGETNTDNNLVSEKKSGSLKAFPSWGAHA